MEFIKNMSTEGSKWCPHSRGNIYTVIAVANIYSDSEKYPITVVYKGDHNERIWAKTLDSFLSTMKPYVKEKSDDRANK